jgi:hypothetical protein
MCYTCATLMLFHLPHSMQPNTWIKRCPVTVGCRKLYFDAPQLAHAHVHNLYLTVNLEMICCSVQSYNLQGALACQHAPSNFAPFDKNATGTWGVATGSRSHDVRTTYVDG